MLSKLSTSDTNVHNETWLHQRIHSIYIAVRNCIKGFIPFTLRYQTAAEVLSCKLRLQAASLWMPYSDMLTAKTTSKQANPDDFVLVMNVMMWLTHEDESADVVMMWWCCPRHFWTSFCQMPLCKTYPDWCHLVGSTPIIFVILVPSLQHLPGQRRHGMPDAARTGCSKQAQFSSVALLPFIFQYCSTFYISSSRLENVQSILLGTKQKVASTFG